MKLAKKIVSVVFALVLVIGLCPIAPYQAEATEGSATGGDLTGGTSDLLTGAADGGSVLSTQKTKYKVVESVPGADAGSTVIKNLKPGVSYKAYARAWIMVAGKKAYVKRGPIVHAYASGKAKKHSAKKIVKVRKAKARVKAGKAFRIKASLGVPLKNGLFPTTHTALLRYYSSNPQVAVVSASGKVRGIAPGKCKVYVLAANGAKRSVSVTVK